MQLNYSKPPWMSSMLRGPRQWGALCSPPTITLQWIELSPQGLISSEVASRAGRQAHWHWATHIRLRGGSTELSSHSTPDIPNPEIHFGKVRWPGNRSCHNNFRIIGLPETSTISIPISEVNLLKPAFPFQWQFSTSPPWSFQRQLHPSFD